jgi:transposase
MFFVGLDVHQRKSSVCVLDSLGKKVKEFTVLGPWDTLLEALAGLPRPMAVCFEASTGCGWLCERIRPLAQRIEVAHPGQVRLIFRAKKKNDRIDAAKLATLLFLGQVPKAYIPDAQVRAWRGLVEFRRATVDKRTRAKNALRALMRGCGIQNLHPRKGLWARKGLALLREIELPAAQDRLRRDLLMDELDQYVRQVKRVEVELDRIADDHAGVALLRSIPGVGARTAEGALAYIDDARRFRRNKQVGAYFGVVPCQDSSADVNRLGHITRQGPPTVRKLLVEAAWQGVRRSPTLGAYYQRIRQGKKERRKIALVATAHHLLRVMHAMLRTGEVWRETVADEQTAAAGTLTAAAKSA